MDNGNGKGMTRGPFTTHAFHEIAQEMVAEFERAVAERGEAKVQKLAPPSECALGMVEGFSVALGRSVSLHALLQTAEGANPADLGATPDQLGEQIASLKREAAAAGRTFGTALAVLGTYVHLLEEALHAAEVEIEVVRDEMPRGGLVEVERVLPEEEEGGAAEGEEDEEGAGTEVDEEGRTNRLVVVAGSPHGLFS